MPDSDLKNEDKQKVYVLITFALPLTCKRELLGIKENILVGVQKGFFEMPGLAGENLCPPKDASNLKREDEPIEWGNVDSEKSRVKSAVMIFECGKDKICECRNNVHSSLRDWLTLFSEYVKFLLKQKFQALEIEDYNRTYSGTSFECFYFNKEGKAQYPSETAKIKVNISSQKCLSKDDFGQICKLCSENKPLSLEYKLMHDAYKALEDKDYRKAIIEAACAVEVSVTNAINEELKKRKLKDTLAEKFKTLGGKLELLEILGMLDKSYNEVLTKPRNNAVHEGEINIESKVAVNALKAAEELLVKFSPWQQFIS